MSDTTTHDDGSRSSAGRGGDAVRDACSWCGHDKADHMAEAGGCLDATDWRDTNDIVCACPMSFDATDRAHEGSGGR